MRTIICIAAAVVLLIQSAPAEDIYLKNGSIVRNVKVTGMREVYRNQHVVFLFNGREATYSMDVIMRIDQVAYNPAIASYRETANDSLRTAFEQASIPTKADTMAMITQSIEQDNAPTLRSPAGKANTPWLIVSALSFIVAVDHFNRAGDIQDAIDASNALAETYRRLGINIPNPDNFAAESQKSRATLFGVLSLAAGVASTIYAFTPVTVTTDGKSISMQYTF